MVSTVASYNGALLVGAPMIQLESSYTRIEIIYDSVTLGWQLIISPIDHQTLSRRVVMVS